MTASLTDEMTDLMNSRLNVNFTKEEYTMIFFMVSKSEHDNQDPDRTFLCANGESVWAYAEALSYDWHQRGVTMGIVGFTTANSGRASWGDATPVLMALKRMGGPDLLTLAETCHENKADAKTLCREIHSLDEEMMRRFATAQMEALTRPKTGYLFEAVNMCRELDVPIKPLLVGAIFDTLLNFGIGGRYCPLAWLRKHGKRGSKTKTLRRLLRWKRRISCINNHNSCKHNGRNRSDQFKRLLRQKEWSLSRKACMKAVWWQMK
jgi:hypothetical protein